MATHSIFIYTHCRKNEAQVKLFLKIPILTHENKNQVVLELKPLNLEGMWVQTKVPRVWKSVGVSKVTTHSLG